MKYVKNKMTGGEPVGFQITSMVQKEMVNKEGDCIPSLNRKVSFCILSCMWRRLACAYYTP